MERAVETGGARITYLTEGPAEAPVLLFINSIGSTRDMWGAQVGHFARRYRTITYDARGHGRSSVPPGNYTIGRLAEDAVAILDNEATARAHVCGLSLGGLTAMWLGVHAPSRVASLTLANTAARIGTPKSWADRIALVREKGMRGVAARVIPLWFTERFRAAAPHTVQVFCDLIESTSTDGYLGCCAALHEEDLRDQVASIACPVLCIAGSVDVPTPPAGLEYVHGQIAGSTLVTLDAAHISNVEQMAAFNAALEVFLSGG
jgi:3-oxoadipate enol-lactonase